MKLQFKWTALGLLALVLVLALTHSMAGKKDTLMVAGSRAANEARNCAPEKEPACVMKTIFGLDGANASPVVFDKTRLPAEALAAVNKGLNWLMQAQSASGGWGAGGHDFQHVKDPHKVKADPATTALVCMAMLRTGNTLTTGEHQIPLQKGTLYLITAVEQWSADDPFLTSLRNTQPQTKLGENIDAILTVQFFTNLIKYEPAHEWTGRIKTALQKCVSRVEAQQDENGSWKGGGWAPVLQSALADNALESAKDAGVTVDSLVLKRSKKYQMGNFDTATRSALTGSSAGIMLYSLSSTNRASAKEARKAKTILEKAKKEGKVENDAVLSEVTLQNAGVAPAEARELVTAFNINEGTYREATKTDVMSGFGNNGGEEFLSYLMTGESVLLQGGETWKNWYNMMSKKIITIQNSDGSWEGHHCITSPVFCTATCLLILSIHDDLAHPGA